MKKAFGILTLILLVISCTLSESPVDTAVYILDWSAEALYVADSTLTFSAEPLLLAGDGPSDIVADDEFVFVSNSGYGGESSVQKFSLEGELLAEEKTGEMTSPGYLEINENHLFMSLWLDNSVKVMTKDSLKEVQTITGVLGPQELLLNGDALYIGSNDIDSCAVIYKVSISDWSKREIEVGPNPSFLDMSDDCGDIFVSCLGDYDKQFGSVVKLTGDSVVERREFGSYLWKIKCAGEYLLVIDAYENCYVLNQIDLTVVDTLFLQSVSDVEVFNSNVIFATNVGKVYLSDLSSITEVTEVLPEPGYKASEIYVK
ncbi:MAG: hypothetical protein PHW02_03960 [bacterium]|nr:hypothetical protein [bacterium]